MRLIYILLIFYSQIIAQMNMAVIEFKGSGISQIDAINITNRFSVYLFETGKVNLVEREMLQRVLAEQDFQMSGCVAAECAVEIGQLAGVEQVVAGTVALSFGVYTLTVRIVDVESGEIVKQIIRDYTGSGQDFILNIVRETAYALIDDAASSQQITSTPAIPIKSGIEAQQQAEIFGGLSLATEPTGASVAIDGHSRGKAPLIAEGLTQGLHVIKFDMAGYHTFTDTISVVRGEMMDYSARLAYNYAALDLTSVPTGATVRINGDLVGKTPLRFGDLMQGTYEVRYDLSEHFSKTQNISVVPGQTKGVSATLDSYRTVSQQYETSLGQHQTSSKRMKISMAAATVFLGLQMVSQNAHDDAKNAKDAIATYDRAVTFYWGRMVIGGIGVVYLWQTLKKQKQMKEARSRLTEAGKL